MRYTSPRTHSLTRWLLWLWHWDFINSISAGAPARTLLGKLKNAYQSVGWGGDNPSPFPTPFNPGKLWSWLIHVQNINVKSYLVQKLYPPWKETDGRTQPIALLTPITQSIIMQCSLTRPMALMQPHAKLPWRFVLYFACMFDLCQCHYMHHTNLMYIISTVLRCRHSHPSMWIFLTQWAYEWCS